MKEPVKAEKPIADKIDGTVEHVETIRYLIAQMQAEKQSDTTLAALDEVTRRVDLLEGKPEAVEAEKAKFAQGQHDKAEKAKAEKAELVNG